MSNSPGVNPSRFRVANADRCGHFSGPLKPFGALVGARRQFRRVVQNRSRGHWPERRAQAGIAPLVPGKPPLGDIFGCWRCVPRGLGGSLWIFLGSPLGALEPPRGRCETFTCSGPWMPSHTVLEGPEDFLLIDQWAWPADQAVVFPPQDGSQISFPNNFRLL